jgi:membrane-bound inhibitor of C-type lysozyme
MDVIRHLRIKLAAGPMLIVLSVLLAAHAHAAPAPTRYVCGGQTVTIERDGKLASVRFADGSYQLQRKASDIGVKYASPTATLIIDGPSAIFVAQDRLQVAACTEAVNIASSR